MKVQLQQSGGFMGALQECSLDTDQLGADEVQAIQESVTNTNWTEAESHPSAIRDGYQYHVRVEDQEQTYTAAYTDQTLPESLKPLVGVLKKYLKPKSLR